MKKQGSEGARGVKEQGEGSSEEGKRAGKAEALAEEHVPSEVLAVRRHLHHLDARGGGQPVMEEMTDARGEAKVM